MTGVLSGLSVVGRDHYGVFPLKGKPLNVRSATHDSILKNEELGNIVKILVSHGIYNLPQWIGPTPPQD